MSYYEAGVILEGIDDVLDYPLEPGEGSSASMELYTHLYNLMKMGNKAFRENRIEQAIDFYARADNLKPGDVVILTNRCSAYLKNSHFLKTRSSAASEYRPLRGMDPTTHAGLALRDAEYVMSMQSNLVTPYILKANALILMEKYELAEHVICAGLQIDPQSDPLMNLQRSIDNTFAGTRHVQLHRTDDYDCTLCFKLLYDPITTPCGHSFCHSCLFQSLDRGNKCPLCRTVLFVSPKLCAISISLNNIIQKNFPQEYAERKLEFNNLSNLGPDLLPLFVMEVILPCQTLQLNIFEPRYKLMVRRIIEGNRRMAMTVLESDTGLVSEDACEVEITDCEPLLDGRIFVEVESRRRCRIVRKWDQDGYRIGEVEWVEDTPPRNEIVRDDILEMTRKAAVLASKWFRVARASAEGDIIRLALLLKAEESMPSTRDPERFSFWLATLSNRSPADRLVLLKLRDTKERIMRGLVYLRAEERGWPMYFRRQN